MPGPAALTVLGPDGSVRWEAPPTAGFVSATQAAIGDGVLLASTICDGPVSVKAWDLESGAPLWSAVLPDSQAGGASLAIVDGVALVTTAGGLSAFDGRSGAPRPSTDGEHGPAVERRADPGWPASSRRTGSRSPAPGCPTPRRLLIPSRPVDSASVHPELRNPEPRGARLGPDAWSERDRGPRPAGSPGYGKPGDPWGLAPSTGGRAGRYQ